MTVSPTKPEKLKGHYVGAIFGAPGVGKTTLAGSAPDPVFIDTGNETLTLAYTKGCEDIPVYKCDSHQKIMEVVADVRVGKIKCRTLIVDNVSDQQRFQLTHSADVLKTGRNFAGVMVPAQQDFRVATVAIGNMIDLMKEDKFPVDVLLLAHVAHVTNKEGHEIATRFGVTPSLAGRILGAVDFALYMTMKVGGSMRKEDERTLRAKPTVLLESKNRISLPDEFPAEDLWSIIESRRG